jgi:ABC-type sugar transport system permease subunit
MKRKLRKKKGFQRKRQGVVGYAFMTPWIIGFLVFTAVPFVYTVYLSFFEVQRTILGWEMNFVGIDNYHMAFLRNADFVTLLIEFVVMQITYAPIITVIAFILALLLNRGLKARGLFRALFFLPVIVMSGPVMHELMDSGGLASVGIEAMTLYNMVYQFSGRIAGALVFMFDNYTVMLWFTGIPIILFISGLQKIDTGILEAARIDSATGWQILWKITVPILRPIVLVSIILTIVQLASYTLNPVLPMIRDAIFQTVAGLGGASAFAWIYAATVLLLIGLAFVFLKGPKDEEPPEVKRRARAWNE